MDDSRWIPAVLLLALGAIVIIVNWVWTLGPLWGRKPASYVPLIGAFLSLGGLLLMPMHTPRWLYVVPFMIDFGSVPGLTWALVYWVFISPRAKVRDVHPNRGHQPHN